MFGLVPGLELGLLELEPESRLLCLGPTPAVAPALGRVALPRPGEPLPPRGVLVPASRVLLRQWGEGALDLPESSTVQLPISLPEPVILVPEPAPGVTVWPELAAMFGLLSLNEGGRGGGQSEPELGRSSLEPEENQDSRHDSQLEYWIVLELGEGRGWELGAGSRLTETQPWGSPSYQRQASPEVTLGSTAPGICRVIEPGLRSKLTSFS